MKTFKEYIKTTEPLVIKTPEQCSEYELILFHQMIKKAGQRTTMEGLLSKAVQLGFYYDGTELAGVAAIKKPDAAKFVFQEAGKPEKTSHYKYEIGWAYVEDRYRNRGVNEKLIKALLNAVNNVPVFCTIRSTNSASIAAFQKLGFELLGDPFYFEGEELIILFVKG